MSQQEVLYGRPNQVIFLRDGGNGLARLYGVQWRRPDEHLSNLYPESEPYPESRANFGHR